jgi:chemotaxis protein methyltransferase CheR
VTAIEGVEVERFRALLSERFGFQLDDAKLGSLGELLGQRVRSLGVGTGAYLRRLSADRGELRELATQLTVSETYFFRYTGHFRAFLERVLPARMEARRTTRRLRLLSAGSASGEEAYTLAILLRDGLTDPSWSVEILAFDVNPSVVARARQGQYTPWSLREMPPDLLARCFHKSGGTFAIDDALRSRVSFEERNLVDEDPTFWRPDAFDVVFCRNVLMYLTPTKMRDVVARIERSLSPGGFLFLGHAETLRGLSQAFHLCHSHDAFYYRLRAEKETVTTLPVESSASVARPDVALGAALGLTDSSWIDVIQRASDRVAALSDGRPSTHPRAGDESPSARANTRWDHGPALEMVRLERFAEAMDLLRAAPASSESDPETRLLWAVLLTNSGQLEQAEKACHEILAADEMSWGAHYLLALCRDHAGDRLAAVDHDQTAAYLEPGFAMPHLHLGLLARRARDMETARRELDQALTLIGGEDASRILLFGGGFNRDGLRALCRAELSMCGGDR